MTTFSQGVSFWQWGSMLATAWMIWQGLASMRAVDRTYGALVADLQRIRAEGKEAATHPVLQGLLTAYDRALARRRQPDVQALVARQLSELMADGRPVGRAVRLVRMAISACVVLGLLGTFLGLFFALRGLSGSLDEAVRQSGSMTEILGLLGQLRTLVGGMSSAFMASILGVLGSLVLTVRAAQLGTFTLAERTADELEHYLANEYEATDVVSAEAELSGRLLERFERLAAALEQGLPASLAGAAEQFRGATEALGQVLGQVEPITRSLGDSGQSLQVLGQGMAEVTAEMRSVMHAMKISQEALPERLVELRTVEEALVTALGTMQDGLRADLAQGARLADGIDLFQAGARQLESALGTFQREWPVIIQEFSARSETALEHYAVRVSESLERLRELSERQQRLTLEQLEALVAGNHALAQAAAASMLGSGPRRG